MGHHYTPQEYLRGFQCPDRPGMIWMYDKKSGRFACASIDKVAQQKGYYSEQNEKLLNDLVERPANPVLKKLRQGQRIDEADRAKLTDYIGTMLMRGPWRRQRVSELAPRVAGETLANVERELTSWAAATSDRELAARRIAEFQQVKLDVAKDPTESLQDFVREPWARPRILEVIDEMNWTFATATGGDFFLTSDNPVWFDEGLGIKNPNSEIVIPISSNLVLTGHWGRTRRQMNYGQARTSTVKEVNRRVAIRAVQFIFSHKNAEWLPGFAKKWRRK